MIQLSDKDEGKGSGAKVLRFDPGVRERRNAARTEQERLAKKVARSHTHPPSHNGSGRKAQSMGGGATEVYGAGEMPEPGVSGKLIVDAICETQNHPDVYYVPDQESIPNVLRMISGPNDTVITLGAGDVSRVGEELLAIL